MPILEKRLIMRQDEVKEKFLDLLDRKAFDPILRAREEDYSGSDLQALHHAQTATRREKERFHHYGGADDVVVNFKRDLHSRQAVRVNDELSRLHLPRLSDIEIDFFQLCDRLGIEH